MEDTAPLDEETTTDATTVVRELMRTEALLRRRLATALKSEGISPEQWLLLEVLWEADGRTQGELAEATWRELATVTRLVDGLVARGLVERRADVFDRRRTRAWLTLAAGQLAKRVRPKVRAELDALAGGLVNEALQGALAMFEQIRMRVWDP